MLQWQSTFTLCICTNLIALFCVSAHIQESNVRIQTLPAYAIASKFDLLNSTACGKELQIFRDAVDQRIMWSLKVLDSSGDFKPGFLYGNNFWMGSRSQCFDTMKMSSLFISKQEILNNTLHRDTQEEFPPFQINYFIAHFRHNSTLQNHINIFHEDVITLGLCLPASCTINNLSFILERIFHDRISLINDLYFADFHLIQVKDLKGGNEWLSSGVLTFVCVSLGLSFLMTIIGTMYDIFVHQKNVERNKINKINSDIEDMSKKRETKINSVLLPKSKIGKIIMCFSAYTNTTKMFNTKLDAATISVIHGLKVLNMCLLIILHFAYFAMDALDNKVQLWKFMESYGFFLYDMTAVLIDTFFFSSGCLVTYLYLRDRKNEISIKPIVFREKLTELFMYIIKRFIRLTPTYMLVLGITQLSSAWFDKTSQFDIYEKSHETCAKYWWRNLLYINNLFSADDMCMIWSWYLANDMQFYIITMTLLVLSTMYFYTAVMILGGLLMGSIIFSGYISNIYEYVLTIDPMGGLSDVFYNPPWMRIIPYIIGIIAGYVLAKFNNNLILKRKIVILCWCIFCFMTTCNIFVSFVLYHKRSVLFTAIYVALHRLFWAIDMAWIVIACCTKHGGIINKLLSFKVWIPLSRLTYCAYLLNPIIMRSICLYSETSIHFEISTWFVLIVGYIVIIFFCAYVLSLMVEIPSNLLMRMFI